MDKALTYGAWGVFNSNFSVAVVVSNGKRSARWYSEKLGFESSVQGHWVTVWPKGAAWKIHLCQQPKSKLEPGNTGISFYAKDVEGTVKELKMRGVKFQTDCTIARSGGGPGQVQALVEVVAKRLL